MRTTYRAGFHLGRHEDDHLTDPDQVAERCLRWIFDRPGVERPPDLDGALDAGNVQIGERAWLRTTRTTDDVFTHWGARFEHVDALEPHLRWVTDLCMQVNHAAGESRFACAVHISSVDGVLIPTYRAPSRPRIVPALLREFGGFAAYPLVAEPLRLTAENADEFLALLEHPDRQRPVVYVSRREDGRTTVNTESLADWLASLAHVYVADDDRVREILAEHLPRRLDCWNGAVRIYWPGFTPGARAHHHPRWLPSDIAELNARPRNGNGNGNGGGFRAFVLGRIAEVAAFTLHGNTITWDLLQRERLRHLRASLRESVEAKRRASEHARTSSDEATQLRRMADDQGELAELWEEEAQKLAEQLNEVRAEKNELAEQLRRERNRRDEWRTWYEHVLHQLPRSQREAIERHLSVTLPVTSVAEAVSRATEEFGGRLVFALNGKSTVDDNPFEEPEELFEALRFLATTYRDARTGTRPRKKFDVPLREACGWWYRPAQTKETMRKYEDWYTTTHAGKTLWLSPHMGTGSSKDARHTIRVAFAWSKADQVVVVGFIGQHQETDAS